MYLNSPHRIRVRQHQFIIPLLASRDNDQRRDRSRSPIRRSSITSKSNGDYLIKMRGMPFTVTEDDVRKVNDD